MIQYHWKGRRYNVTSQTYNDYVDLHPIYGDKLSIKHSMPDDERYYKESFNGTLKFVCDDYSWIMDVVDGVTRFNTIYELELMMQTQIVTTLKFVITDCEVDEDNGIITVKPSTKSRYDDLLNGLDREFNLVDLNPAIYNLEWYKRAIIQVYVGGEDTITNFLGSIHWEQETAKKVSDWQELYDVYHLYQCAAYREVTITGSDTSVNDTYYGAASTNTYVFDYDLFPIESNGYKVHFHSETYGDGVSCSVSVVRISDNYVKYYQSTVINNGVMPDTDTNKRLLDHEGAQSGTYCSYITPRIYSRILCDVARIGNNNTYTRPSSDIVTNDGIYNRVYPYNATIESSLRLRQAPTPYGQFLRWYYQPPTDNDIDWMPIASSNWRRVSYWYDIASSAYDDSDARKGITLQHAYPLYSAIKVLLAQIAPDLSFDETTAYSEFLFDYDDSTHPLVRDVVHLFITPKTNILKGDYNTPAYNAPIKLKEILDMLKAVYKCYWFIDTDNRLRIEHVSWFMNGGTYSNPSQAVSYDLTTLKNSRNGKAWAYETNKYTFDKPNMPATYTFAWMDDVTQEFKGYQMEMQSQLVEKGKNEEINVGKFTTDIDFVTISPDDISKDGFMLLGASEIEGEYYMPFYPLRIEGTNIINNLQNGFLAYIYLEKTRIWLDNLPAPSVSYADGTTASVTMQSRMKQQDVAVPMTSPIFDPITLIETSVGEGEIQDIEINLSSLTAKAKLRYDTQQ